MDGYSEPVVFRLKTKEYKLTLPAPAIRLFEQKSGRGILTIGDDLPMNLTLAVTLLWAAAVTNSPHLQLDKLFEIVELADLPAIVEALTLCITRALRLEEKKAGAPAPLDQVQDDPKPS